MGDVQFRLGEERLTAARLVALAASPNPKLTVTTETWARCERYRAIVQKVVESPEKVYGINTGFGYLSDVAIERSKLHQLQVNLVRSHACGVGRLVEDEVVRALLVLRAHTFLLGHSGVRRQTVETILTFLEQDVLPVIPCPGSVGATGHLA